MGVSLAHSRSGLHQRVDRSETGISEVDRQKREKGAGHHLNFSDFLDNLFILNLVYGKSFSCARCGVCYISGKSRSEAKDLFR